MTTGDDRTAPPKVRRNARGKRPYFYEKPAVAAQGVDHAMSMILVLAQEFAVLRDRLDTIERVCAAKGVVLADEIENYHPDQEVLEAREAARQRFLGRLYYLARKEAGEAEEADTANRYAKVLKDIAKS